MDKNTIFYIGGSPCSGKSSIAEILAARYNLTYLRLDDRLFDHIADANPDTQPVLAGLAAADCDQQWLIPPVEQTRREIRAYVEEFPMHLADIAEKPRPLLLEAAALMPCLVAPRLADRHHAIYMVPTAAFQRHHYAQRPWIHDVLHDCSDPDQAFINWMQRDVIFARWVRQEALRLGLKTLIVDGSQSIESTAEQVARHFGLSANP